MYRDNRITVRFANDWHDDSGHWFRSYGNENWEFDENAICSGALPVSTICRSTKTIKNVIGRLDAGRMIIRTFRSRDCEEDDMRS